MKKKKRFCAPFLQVIKKVPFLMRGADPLKFFLNFRAGIGKGKRFQSLRFVKTRDFAVHAAKID